MRYAEITEAIEDRLLHATSVDLLYEILEANEIKANTGHPITHTGGEKRSRHWAVRPAHPQRKFCPQLEKSQLAK